MHQRLPLEEMPPLLERVQVTYHSLRQAHERLGASLVLFKHVVAIRSKYGKRAIKIVRAMGGLAASLHTSLSTLDDPALFTVGLRPRLGLLIQYTDKAAMQLVLVQSCCRRDTAIARWLHQQACAYLDAVMSISQETLRELARVARRVSRAASHHQQASVEGAGNDDAPTTIQVLVPHG